MTKRRHKTHAPGGLNAGLANALMNQAKAVKRHPARTAATSSNGSSNKPVLESKTAESDMQEFLTNAELANATFEAEKGDVKLLSSIGGVVAVEDLVNNEKRSLDQLNAQFGHLLRIPRRPAPGSYQNAEELEAREAQEFLAWRRQLAKLAEGNGLVITPFERNLEIWRQLWRVVERSHVVVQVVDARNPLLFRSRDLECFVTELDPRKRSVLLINKADLLTPEQIHSWADYFKAQGIHAIFWSAKQDEKMVRKKSMDEEKSSSTSSSSDEDEEEEEEEEKRQDEKVEGEEEDQDEEVDDDADEKEEKSNPPTAQFFTSPSKLLSELHQIAASSFGPGDGFIIGMVGYPNVGKSSTINRLLGAKKTPVSSTPGKTKHFQTLIIDERITLCDCPGLVMPQFGLSNAEMLLNGILPIAHMRDYHGPVQLLCNRVPGTVLQKHYSILLPQREGPVQAHDLLTSVAFLKGFMSSAGIPDCSRSARLILADVVDGSLRWAAAPPTMPQEQFDQWTFASLPLSKAHQRALEKETKRPIGANLLEQLEKRQLLLDSGSARNKGNRIDKNFFDHTKLGTNMAHIQGGIGRLDVKNSSNKHHGNKNKRQKLRRVFLSSNE